MFINLWYYGLVAVVRGKASEDIELKEKPSVEDAVNILVEKYGKNLRKGS